MNRRLLLSLVSASALVVALAACGSDGSSSNDSPTSGPGSTPDASGPDGTAGPADTLPLPDGFAHPTGPDDEIVNYSELSGFTTMEYAFQQPPMVLISGDGLVFTTGPQIAIYPGPALPNIQVGTITEQGIQTILTAADEAGLFADVDYEAPTNVADASTATVTLNVDGVSWVHEAYALGIGAGPEAPAGSEATPEREALLAFTSQLMDLPSLVGADQLGPVEAFEPEEYLIRAVPVTDPDSMGGDGIEPTIVEWPAAAGVTLADAGECAVVTAADVGDLFVEANQLTFFTEGDTTYQVIAVQRLPHRTCP
jgi:hypothetical protein